MPVLAGRKSESERFPGAVDTYTIEALMRDGQALQAAHVALPRPRFRRMRSTSASPDATGAEHTATPRPGASTHAPGRRRRHGARRRPRAAAAAGLAPHQVVIVPISRDDGAAAVSRRRRRRRRAAGRRCPGPRRRPARAPARLQVQRVGAQGRPGAARARRPRPRRRHGHGRAPRHGGQAADPAAGEADTTVELLGDMQASLLQTARDEQERRTLRDPRATPS